MREALIILLLKPRKDPLKCDSYCPISLINVDVKILAKVLATRLNTVVATLVNSDQGGFIPGRSTRMNIRSLFHNIQYQHDCSPIHAIVSLDTCKAFDSVEWPYLFQVLQLYGFGPRVITWIKFLYTSPVARIRVNSCVTDSFLISRGTRQGGPLSPLLFALAMEPPAVRICSSPLIKGLPIATIEEQVSMYADDTLVYLADTHESLHALLTSPNNPLWFNLNLQELYSLPDPNHWYSKRVKYLCHLYDAQGFKSFHQLRTNFDLPHSYIFYYYQLRYAVHTQFGSLDDPTTITPLEKLLRHPDPTKLVSTYYGALITDFNSRFHNAQAKWTSMDISLKDDD